MKVQFLDLRSPVNEALSEYEKAISGVIASGLYVNGDECRLFEEEWSNFTEAEHTVGVANGLDALYLSLLSIGVGVGDEVLVPSLTFIATWLSVTKTGARPVPVDVDPVTYNMNPSLIKEKVTERTKAIVPVHLYGLPASMKEISDIANVLHLAVIEDAAQAHGSTYRERPIGSHSDLVCWSFYPGKNLGAFGDAGAVTTKSVELKAKIRMLSNYGSYSKYEHVDSLGVNSRLDAIQAAVLRVKLKYLEQWNIRRQKQASVYIEGLKDSGFILPKIETNESKSSCHLFVIRTKNRAALREWLETAGIESGIHYPKPPYLQQAYIQSHSSYLQEFERTTAMCDQLLSLPIGPHLKPEQQEYIVESLLEFKGDA